MRGIIQITGTLMTNIGKRYPERVLGMPVNRECRRLHFLHGLSGGDDQGHKAASYIIHFQDGQMEEIPLVSGEDAAGWEGDANEPKEVPNAVLAWTGTNESLRDRGRLLHLYRRTWDNPRPEVPVSSVDYISANSMAAPFLLAITVDSKPASSDNCKTFLTERFPPRNPRCPSGLIDLSAYYNASLKDGKSWQGLVGDDLLMLPRGLQRLDGVEFDIRGIIQLNSTNFSEQRFSALVTDIRINQSLRRLHFLHATCLSEATDHFESDGAQIGTYRIHYRNGDQREIPIIYGKDVRDTWQSDADPLPAANATVAWTGSNPAIWPTGHSLQLFHTTWENPLPEAEVASMDFISAMKTSAPFLIAITAE